MEGDRKGEPEGESSEEAARDFKEVSNDVVLVKEVIDTLEDENDKEDSIEGLEISEKENSNNETKTIQITDVGNEDHVENVDVPKESIESKNLQGTDKIIKETISPDIHSILPCPKGCSLSAGLAPSLKPNKVIIDDKQSDKLLKESAKIATLFIKNPTKNLAINNNTLLNIPTKLPSSPYFFLTFSSFMF